MSPEERVERIFGALDAVFARIGLERTTMAAIAAEAGMSKRTLYGLFADRDELLGAYIARIRGQFVHELEERDVDLSLEDRLRRLLAPCPRTSGSDLPVAVLRLALSGTETGPGSARARLARLRRQDRDLVRIELDRAVTRGEASIPDTAAAAAILEGMIRPSIADLLLDPATTSDRDAIHARFETGLTMFLAAVEP